VRWWDWRRLPSQGGVGEEDGEAQGSFAGKIGELLDEIERVNEAEEEEYGDEDLEEMGGQGGIDAEKLKERWRN